MTTMLQTLDETAGAYTSKTRAIARDGSCWYFQAGKCCAVGRCLEDPKRFSSVDANVSYLDAEYGLDSILKPEYRGFPLTFWTVLQRLHDNEDNWDENGLSEHGKQSAKRIKEKFKL